MEQVKQLAAEMGVTETDLVGFLMLLRHYMDKGMTLDAAINMVHRKSELAMQWAYRMSQDKEFRHCMADQLWDLVNEKVA